MVQTDLITTYKKDKQLSTNTTQKTEDTEIFQEKFEDTKEAIKTRKSKDRQHNGQKKKDKRTNNDL